MSEYQPEKDRTLVSRIETEAEPGVTADPVLAQSH